VSRKKYLFYGPSEELWRRFLSICRREGSSGSERLTEFIRRYVEVHAPGNPQTVMNSYAPDGSVTRENVEGRVRQLALEESRKRGGELGYRRIIELVKSEGVQGKVAVAMADRTATWLHKAMKVKVWR
jgi:hypothetical protein